VSRCEAVVIRRLWFRWPVDFGKGYRLPARLDAEPFEATADLDRRKGRGWSSRETRRCGGVGSDGRVRRQAGRRPARGWACGAIRAHHAAKMIMFAGERDESQMLRSRCQAYAPPLG
jgi:hypothetical protein